jgi:hypothetical protein
MVEGLRSSLATIRNVSSPCATLFRTAGCCLGRARVVLACAQTIAPVFSLAFCFAPLALVTGHGADQGGFEWFVWGFLRFLSSNHNCL